MSYIHITHTPGVGLKEYRKVREGLGPEPIEGNRLHIVGELDGVLHIVDVWDSAAAGDKFAAERLFPVFERLGIKPGPDATIEAFEGEVTNLG
ncbi:hypothetical protein [Nocardia sp. CDC160]|uniref:hypothetical protein n=1 Tax=Nocardia sp. CDC160 TaxID=3112166 RepID=UPI002DB78BA8|nr:hypothetical protein [Nocardia sp. CDC160]MEC3915550.1 hypothetical protein [Nocardia sp. CDC160]